MKLRRITDVNDQELPELIRLYEEAFPVEERRPVEKLKGLIREKTEMFFNAISEGEKLAGLFIYWDMGDFYFLEHLAVFEEFRNQKIGQKVLDFVNEHLKGERLLEVEHPCDEITERRVNYYRRNGYEVVEKEYMQLPYSRGKQGIPLWVMSNKTSVLPELLNEHIEQIKEIVYRKNW